MSFIASFGVVKALANLVSGKFADIYRREHMLVLGWLVGLPVPLMIASAPSWGSAISANSLLGIQSGLRLFRPVFFGGFIAPALGLGSITEARHLAAGIVLALLCGLGVGVVGTVAPLFVVDFVPKSEWNPHIGWL